MIQGILLAAGRGQRFDPSGEKDKLLQLRPDSGKPVLWHSGSTMSKMLPGTLAVIQGHQPKRVHCLFDAGCEVLISPEAQHGMGSALAAAVKHSVEKKPGITGFIISLGDMPWVPVEAVARVHAELLKVSTQELHAVAPCFEGKRGHPVGLTRAWASSLIALQGDVGAKHLLRNANMIAINWPSADVLQDVDVPEDLA
jgi:molybdenum cofactor cytidylyltransferase